MSFKNNIDAFCQLWVDIDRGLDSSFKCSTFWAAVNRVDFSVGSSIITNIIIEIMIECQINVLTTYVE